jgi:hypothetical protein
MEELIVFTWDRGVESAVQYLERSDLPRDTDILQSVDASVSGRVGLQADAGHRTIERFT